MRNLYAKIFADKTSLGYTYYQQCMQEVPSLAQTPIKKVMEILDEIQAVNKTNFMQVTLFLFFVDVVKVLGKLFIFSGSSGVLFTSKGILPWPLNSSTGYDMELYPLAQYRQEYEKFSDILLVFILFNF